VLRIGYMPEERGLYKKMKIGEQAVYLARLKGLSRVDAMDRVKQWFIKFGMESWWNKKVEDLSKGMGQKLQFVTTVLHEPKLIILDEPFSGLDPVNTNLIKDEIYNLAKKGCSIIFSTHRMEQVEEICDHIILVNKGKKILDGGVNQVKQEFKENLFRIGFEKAPTNSLSGSFDVIKQEDHSFIVKINQGYSPNDVLKYFIQQDTSITAFNEILPSLNEIFIKLVEGTAHSRQFQTVTASPAAGALITVLGAANTSSRQGLAFHKDAFAMGCADLPLPEGVDKAARVNSKQLGMSIRMIRAYDINQDRWPTRLDILYGWTTLYAELACRVAS